MTLSQHHNISIQTLRYMAVLVLILFLKMDSYGKQPSNPERLVSQYYKNKIIDPVTHIFYYPRKYIISKQEAKKKNQYYLIYKKPGGLVAKEEQYVNHNMVSHYLFHYDKNRLIKEEYYDNLVLIMIRKFKYTQKGQLIRIERYDKSKKPEGDWYYLDLKGNIQKIERYRNEKISYLQLFKGRRLVETRYFSHNITKITKYNRFGQVLSENSIDEDKENQIHTVVNVRPIHNFSVTEVRKLQIKQGLNSIICTKRGSQWILSSANGTFEGDNMVLSNLLKNISDLELFKTFKGKKLAKDKYGLAKPDKSISIWTHQQRLNILVGEALGRENAYYVSTNQVDDEIYLVSKDRVDYILEKDINDLRVKEFLKAKGSRIHTVSLDRLNFVKRREGWVLDPKRNSSLKDSEKTVHTIINMRATRFIDDEKAKTPFKTMKPTHVIILKGNHKKYKILVYEKHEKMYVKTDFSKTIYRVPYYVIRFLEKMHKHFLSH